MKFLFILQVIQSDSLKVMGQNDPTFLCDGTNNTFRVMFKEPVEILPNISYTACATLKVKLKIINSAILKRKIYFTI